MSSNVTAPRAWPLVIGGLLLLFAGSCSIFRAERPLSREPRSATETQPYVLRQPAQLNDCWQTGTPEGVGRSRDALETMTEALGRGEYPNVHAVLIAKDGKLVYEEYFDGVDRRWQEDGQRRDVRTTFDREMLHDVRSVAKSVTSAAFGFAVADGSIGSLDQPLFDFFPEYNHLATPEKRRITLRHVLTMTAGLDWNENELRPTDPGYHETLMYETSDPAGFILARPLDTEPGERWDYNGGLTTLLGIVIGRATGRSFGEYTRERLFEPLGVERVEWGWLGGDGLGGIGENAWKDVPELRWEGSERWSNVASPPFALWMGPRDLLKIGSLYLSGGRWCGRQILPESWVEESLQPHVEKGPPSENGEGASSRGAYGYQWHHEHYRLPYGELEVHSARGNGGQRIWVVPELGLTAVHVTGNYNVWTASYQAERSLLEHIVPWALDIEASYQHEIPRPVRVVEPGEWPRVELSGVERALYVGTYEEKETGDRMEVFEEEDGLRLTLPGSGAVHLISEGGHVFAAGRIDGGSVRKVFWPGARMHFVLGERGKVDGFEWREATTARVTSVGRRVR